jgi:hypothetical protein
MSTEFNDRSAHDRPLNDRLSDVPPSDKDTVNDDIGNKDTVNNKDTEYTDTEYADAEYAETGDRTRFEEPESSVDTESRVDTDLDTGRESRVDTDRESPADIDVAPVADERLAHDSSAHEKTLVPQQENRSLLFEQQEADQFRTQWREVQSSFVDEPQTAVREADTLLAKMMDELKTRIESHRGDVGNGDTEELRLAMQRYRSLFDQILSV